MLAQYVCYIYSLRVLLHVLHTMVEAIAALRVVLLEGVQLLTARPVQQLYSED